MVDDLKLSGKMIISLDVYRVFRKSSVGNAYIRTFFGVKSVVRIRFAFCAMVHLRTVCDVQDANECWMEVVRCLQRKVPALYPPSTVSNTQFCFCYCHWYSSTITLVGKFITRMWRYYYTMQWRWKSSFLYILCAKFCCWSCVVDKC